MHPKSSFPPFLPHRTGLKLEQFCVTSTKNHDIAFIRAPVTFIKQHHGYHQLGPANARRQAAEPGGRYKSALRPAGFAARTCTSSTANCPTRAFPLFPGMRSSAGSLRLAQRSMAFPSMNEWACRGWDGLAEHAAFARAAGKIFVKRPASRAIKSMAAMRSMQLPMHGTVSA